jgi:hypothetical protein
MMQWMAGAGSVSMDAVMLDQVARLSAQMNAAQKAAELKEDKK